MKFKLPWLKYYFSLIFRIIPISKKGAIEVDYSFNSVKTLITKMEYTIIMS